MKKIITHSLVAIALVAIAGITSCQKKILVFVKIDEKDYCFGQQSTQLSTGFIDTFEFDVAKFRQEFGNRNLTYAENRINDIKVSSFTISFFSGLQGNLKELSGIQVYAKKAGESGLGIQVAEVSIPESDVAEVNLNPTGESLKGFLAEDKIIFTVNVFQRYPGGSQAICVKLKSGVIEIEAKQ